MTVTYSDHPQGTPEWHLERAKLLTASNFRTAIGTGETRLNLMRSIIAARCYGVVEESFQSQWNAPRQ